MAETFPEPANASCRVRGLTTVPEADAVASTVPRATVVVRRVEDWAVLDEPWSVTKTPAAIRTRTTSEHSVQQESPCGLDDSWSTALRPLLLKEA